MRNDKNQRPVACKYIHKHQYNNNFTKNLTAKTRPNPAGGKANIWPPLNFAAAAPAPRAVHAGERREPVRVKCQPAGRRSIKVAAQAGQPHFSSSFTGGKTCCITPSFSPASPSPPSSGRPTRAGAAAGYILCLRFLNKN